MRREGSAVAEDRAATEGEGASLIKRIESNFVGYTWFLCTVLGLGIVFFLADASSILVIKGVVFKTQTFCTSLGRLLPIPVLLLLYFRQSKQAASETECADVPLFVGRPVRLLVIACAVTLGIGLSAVLEVLGGVQFHDEVFVSYLQSFLIGIGNSLLLIAWGEWLLRLDKTAAFAAIAFSFVTAGFLELSTAALRADAILMLFTILPFLCVLCLRGCAKFFLTSQSVQGDDRGGRRDDDRDASHASGAATVRTAPRYGLDLDCADVDPRRFALSGVLLVFLFSVLNCTMQAPGIVSYPDTLSALLTQGYASFGIIVAGVIVYVLVAYGQRGQTSSFRYLVIITPVLMVVLYSIAILFSGLMSLFVLPIFITKKLLFFLAFVGATMLVGFSRQMMVLVCYTLLAALSNVFYFTTSALVAQYDVPWDTIVQVAALVCVFVVFGKAFFNMREKEPRSNARVLDDASDLELSLEKRGLTRREMEVALHLAAGRSSGDIAKLLVLSPATVRTHASHIYAKFEVSSQSEFIVALITGDEGSECGASAE